MDYNIKTINLWLTVYMKIIKKKRIKIIKKQNYTKDLIAGNAVAFRRKILLLSFQNQQNRIFSGKHSARDTAFQGRKVFGTFEKRTPGS